MSSGLVSIINNLYQSSTTNLSDKVVFFPGSSITCSHGTPSPSTWEQYITGEADPVEFYIPAPSAEVSTGAILDYSYYFRINLDNLAGAADTDRGLLGTPVNIYLYKNGHVYVDGVDSGETYTADSYAKCRCKVVVGEYNKFWLDDVLIYSDALGGVPAKVGVFKDHNNIADKMYMSNAFLRWRGVQ